MRSLPSIILLLVLCLTLNAQSPHGEELTVACEDCHTTEGWLMIPGTYKFTHDSTLFPLTGQHQAVNCKMCHQSLVFSEAQTDCFTCHTDMHYQTVGFDCQRCHTTKSWIVENITEIHQLSRFPLLGAHRTADCYTCHPSTSLLRFEPLGIECIDCHQADYLATTSPNHVEGNISTDCIECHRMDAFSWTGAGIDHSFFPLTQGHAINDCKQCHTSGDYSNISSECNSCHQTDYQETSNPDHQSVGLSVFCSECHTTMSGWKPATFTEHDGGFFPIYSGEHNGEWNSCADCHANPADYSLFTCIDCHEHNQADMDDEHEDIGGYAYNNIACYECHPTGSAEGGFDHNLSAFPLTGAHLTTACADCHSDGYVGTPTICFECHLQDFNQTTNPNHNEIGLDNVCELCHTTAPGWKPASFPVHNEYYPLNGAHGRIASDCFACHEGSYVNSPNTCFQCHSEDYNQTTDPPHAEAQFSTECQTCHTEDAWIPSTFEHDIQYFPIYSGTHNNEWTSCNECHTIPGNYALFSCIDCHDHNQADMDREHQGIGGYSYNSMACFECHPDGQGQGGFNHNQTNFPLTGAHITALCADCHENGYTGTTTICSECHEADFNQATNPNHVELAIPDDCESCHTTNPGWEPATFPIHNEYYQLNGAHGRIASDCFACHEGNYNGTPNSCFGCHAEDYNQTTDPSHLASQFPTECTLCHTESAWEPSNFNHNETIFPLTGAHTTTLCADCHENGYTGTTTICSECHEADFNQATNPNHVELAIPDDCESCHTTNPNWQPALFPVHNEYYPLVGAHSQIAADCFVCHEGNYNSTPSTCYGCHADDYNQTNDPPHQTAQFPTDCELCHTQTAWEPSTFNHDALYFPIYSGEHEDEWDQCSDCHTNPGNYAIFDCLGCHDQASTDREHDEVTGYIYNSIACLDCHPRGSAPNMMIRR
jgi:hypothetical protein